MQEIIDILRDQKMTISFMESCTGGGYANAFTNIPDSSDVFAFGAVTYANSFKIKLGVSPKTIQKYTVYSLEVAKEMALNIALYADSDYGLGITGQLKKPDKKNLVDNDDEVYVAFYDRKKDKFLTLKLQVTSNKRGTNKKIVIDKTTKMLKEYLISCKH